MGGLSGAADFAFALSVGFVVFAFAICFFLRFVLLKLGNKKSPAFPHVSAQIPQGVRVSEIPPYNLLFYYGIIGSGRNYSIINGKLSDKQKRHLLSLGDVLYV